MHYDQKQNRIKISVRELCQYALMKGDLNLSLGVKSPWKESMQVGKEVHKQIQNDHKEPNYQAEVPLSFLVNDGGIPFEISGIADGIWEKDGMLFVEEIKTVIGQKRGFAPTAFQRLQLSCYAHFLCILRNISHISMRFTVFYTQTQEIRFKEEICDAITLERIFGELLQSVSFRAKDLIAKNQVRIPSVKSVKFPYSSLRQGQETMIRECYREIKHGNQLFVQAPTGIGKTISTLYPAVRAMGDGAIDKIFYLTAKASTRREAFRASADLFSVGSRLRTLILTSREQLCPNQNACRDPAGITSHCNPASCPYACSFYDKLPQAVEYALSQYNGFPAQTISEIAEKFGICPYEFQLELSEFCEILICDYNYVFDPMVYLRRYFGGEENGKEKYALLVDEAHNLPDRACSMYSETVNFFALSALFLENAEISDEYRNLLQPLTDALNRLRTLCKDSSETDENGVSHGFYLSPELPQTLLKTVADTERILEKRILFDPSVPPAILKISSTLRRFAVIADFYDSGFRTFLEEHGEDFSVRLICLDPSPLLKSSLQKFHAAVMFSATLTPTDYFADILGGSKHAVRLSLPSPFPQENLLLCAMSGISTRYSDRAKSLKKLVSAIAATVSGKKGNYIVYFPSYDYMESAWKLFGEKYPKVPKVKQTKGMSLKEKEAFLDSFTADGSLRIGFCVLGGSFSEGVDLPGKRLIGVLIVGTGLPGISSERNILAEYYESTREHHGRDYAYVYPGMNRILQAAGRVIRREDDKGVVILLDDRYVSPALKSLFPPHWSHLQTAEDSFELADIVSDFWKNRK